MYEMKAEFFISKMHKKVDSESFLQENKSLIIIENSTATETKYNKLILTYPDLAFRFNTSEITVECTEFSRLKLLIGVVPNSVIIYASKLYSGSTSDKKNCRPLWSFLLSDLMPFNALVNFQNSIDIHFHYKMNEFCHQSMFQVLRQYVIVNMLIQLSSHKFEFITITICSKCRRIPLNVNKLGSAPFSLHIKHIKKVFILHMTCIDLIINVTLFGSLPIVLNCNILSRILIPSKCQNSSFELSFPAVFSGNNTLLDCVGMVDNCTQLPLNSLS
ncbi:hypothetical protein AGLY_012201 [Aphis glycines]|uniref:Uncharacterized protein n=1 Tax=Aphis glycines TaxID=307491 RepID=A0A6G0T9K1_APHGL|nr:hypothetical protein AGLY_012201 [Aphis glycines]